MTINENRLKRRDFLRGALIGTILIPVGGSLVSCVGGGGGGNAAGPSGEVTPTNPFGMAANSTVDAVIFNGGYGVEYTEFAGGLVEDLQEGSTVDITPATNLGQTLQPRFVAGNPPDVIDNSGAGLIAINTIRDQLEDLNDVLDAENYEGTVIRDTLYPGVVEPGTFDGKFVQLNYVLTVYALWYSASLFEQQGWTVPQTYDELMELGAQAKAQGKYLFGWGTEAATYYQTMAISSAIKQGGDEVRLALGNLEPDAWSLPAVQNVFTALKEIVDAGYVQPGGSGTQFTAAQAQWSNAQEFVLYPSGGWIENEMRDQTADDFQMTGAPEPVISTSDAAFPWEALHSTAGEGFVVPSQGANVAGGKEFMRAMLSKDAAVNFAKSTFSSTIVRDTVPADGFGSTALVSQVEMLEAAGDNIFSWSFVDLYGTNVDQLVVWNTFLQGGSDVAELTSALQAISDAIADDDSIEKITVE